jgi:hypothetical protein
MYTIIHVEKGWIVCDGQTKLIRFNRKSVAVRTAHNAEKLAGIHPPAREGHRRSNFRSETSYSIATARVDRNVSRRISIIAAAL